ncbi:MAG: methionine adenosyltransferase [Chloroflexi bacterium]|nr:methionine adenosyltransferase [Chloroflexota bacterium]
MPRSVVVLSNSRPPMAEQPIEVVERKGIGHPDTICDAIMERVALALAAAYTAEVGRILHFNVDKSLLVGGDARPRFGGGSVLRPVTFVFGGRATTRFEGRTFDVGEIAGRAATDWLATNLRHLDPHRHVRFHSRIHPGAASLTSILERHPITANDTSATIAYAPLTDTERLVRAAERYVNSSEFKRAFPETGEDVKVLGVRRGDSLVLTLAIAFVGRYLASEEQYFRRKAEVQAAVFEHAWANRGDLGKVEVQVNTLDRRGAGAAGVYLTVTGTSAESGDDGQVGRGNGINGLIALNRPRTTEAPAGKNPVSHVGKIYTALAQTVADEVVSRVSGVREAYVGLASQIGKPIDEPLIAWADVSLAPGADKSTIDAEIAALVDAALAEVDAFSQQLAMGARKLYE